MNNRKRKLIFFLIYTLNDLGHIYTLQGKLEEAKKNLNESLTLSREFPSAKGVIRPKSALDKLGWVAFAKVNYEQAETYWLEALEDIDADFHPLAKVETLTSLCTLAITQKELKQAKRLTQEIDVLLNQSKQDYEYWFEAKCAQLQNKASFELFEGKHKHARKYLLEALDIAITWTIFLGQFNILRIYSDILQEEDKILEAIKCLKVISAHDSCPYITKQTAIIQLEELSTIDNKKPVLDIEDSATAQSKLNQIIQEVMQDLAN